MTADELFKSVLVPAVSGLGGGGLISWFFREWIGTRLKAGIEHEYGLKLEAHKADLRREQEVAILRIKSEAERQAAVYTGAHNAFAEGQKASMERKLQGVDRLWRRILNWRSVQSSLLPVLDLSATPDELRSIKSDPVFSTPFKELREVLRELASEDIEEFRPYVGEYMWALCFSYRAILLRILVFNDANQLEWYKDHGIRQIIRSVLTADELSLFDQIQAGKFAFIFQRLETKILSAAQKVISGEDFGAEAMEQAAKIQEQLRIVNSPQTRVEKPA